MQFQIPRKYKYKDSMTKDKDIGYKIKEQLRIWPQKRIRQITKVIYIKINKVHPNLLKNRFNNIRFFLLIDKEKKSNRKISKMRQENLGHRLP
jgi:hypothetical protein